ncbi:MAG TPA: ECF transporter S component [Halanaerobiaceae bacterium]|nr:ECF transporter S component [Bacillota bacterium]HHU92537.1 ECF transporter S component [Halanaerobiaceae bacterium]HOA41712.1 ECF transporter S component [Halanaerobiales bacterium]HPZ63820.1 ECF transporter S component [Halanaerobiales bacterium]HQD05019.1 ECF transporter S component [Halanaerobiales bacterium]
MKYLAQKKRKGLRNTRSLTILAVMLAITIILDVTPLGAIPLGSISATVLHIPTIITGLIAGPVAGLIMGTLLGLVSLLHALTRPVTPLDPLFINPLVSVLPRIFIGLVAYYVYVGVKKLFRKERAGETVSTLLAGAAGSLTNTALVFLMLYLIYARRVVEIVGAAFNVILISVFTTNAIAEAVISAIVTTAIVVAYKNYSRNK